MFVCHFPRASHLQYISNWFPSHWHHCLWSVPLCICITVGRQSQSAEIRKKRQWKLYLSAVCTCTTYTLTGSILLLVCNTWASIPLNCKRLMLQRLTIFVTGTSVCILGCATLDHHISPMKQARGYEASKKISNSQWSRDVLNYRPTKHFKLIGHTGQARCTNKGLSIGTSEPIASLHLVNSNRQSLTRKQFVA